jgi:hypothetical protein
MKSTDSFMTCLLGKLSNVIMVLQITNITNNKSIKMCNLVTETKANSHFSSIVIGSIRQNDTQKKFI